MNPIDISVIIPIYNVEEYLVECLDSVQELTSLVNTEILLVDDGSTDRSGEIAKHYCEKNTAFIYYYKDNGGVSSARNYGIDHASGEYILFVDADDIIVSRVYKEMLAVGRKQDSDIVKCSFARLEDGSIKRSKLAARGYYNISTGKTTIAESTCLVYDTVSEDKLIRRSLFIDNDIRFPEGIIYNEDEPVNGRLYHYANHCSVYFKTGYLWRIRTGESRSVTQNKKETLILHHKIEMMKDMIDFHIENNSGDEVVHKLKMKSFGINLPAFIRLLKDVPREEALERLDYINDFIEGYCTSDVKEKLPAIFGQVFEDISKRDIDHLILVGNYWSSSYGKAPFHYKDNGDITISLPPDLFSKTEYTAKNEYLETIPDIAINGCEFRDDKLILSGYIYQSRVQTSKQFPQTVEAFLIDSVTDSKIALETDTIPSPYLTENHGTVICHSDHVAYKYDYDMSGFRISIDLKKIDHTVGITGDLALLIHHTNVLSDGYQLARGMKAEVKKKLKSWKHEGAHSEISVFLDRAGGVFIRRKETVRQAEEKAEGSVKKQSQKKAFKRFALWHRKK